jgi:hypothetical protein
MAGDIMYKKAGMPVITEAAVGMSSEMVGNPEFLDSARKRPQDFTRDRKMPFQKLVLFMLNMVRNSAQTCLDRFFEMIGQEDVHMTQQSFSEARHKIRWEAFRELFTAIVDFIYTGYTKTWHGYRVSAIDGSKLRIPDDKELRDYFGTVGKGNSAATAQASALYDVFSNVLIDAQLEPIGTGERELALRHIDALRELPSFGKELVLFDRGYASYELVEALLGYGISFVMRVRKKFSVSIDRFGEGDHRAMLKNKEGREIGVRVIKFALSSGEEETLITDVADMRMGTKAFKGLYFKRWPIETKYDEIKNRLEVENFSGRTVEAVKQDFFITMYMSNIAAIACWEAQEVVDEARKQKANKYYYHVNVNHAIGTLKDRFILAMLEPSAWVRSYKVKRILRLLIEHVVPWRPGRSIPRNPIPRKAKFRHNRKSNC